MAGSRKGVCAALLLAVPLAAERPAAAQDETSIALPAVSLVFSPIYIANSAGFWEKRGLKVKMHDITGIGAMNAVFAKSVDFSSSSGPTIIRAHIRGQKVLGVAETLDGLAIEIVLRKDVAEAAGVTDASPVDKRAAALKGKRMSLTSVNTIPHAHLRYLARKGGVDPERDFTVVSNLAPAGFAALKSGNVEGFVQGPPWTPLAVHEKIGVLISSPLRGDLPELAPLAFNIVVTRPDVCTDRPSVCAKMVAGVTDAMNYMHDHPKESIEHLAKRMPGMDAGVFAESFELIRKWTPRTAEIKEPAMLNAQQLMLVGGMLKDSEKLASFKDLYTNKFAK
jgi:ABC-type nitrate/sulfonate/bicarbonate transport system substrate-binding protein